MKLRLPEIVTEASADFKTSSFGIKNPALLLEIVRGKMYSDPIRVIVQEYISNARDAHREIGRESWPLHIKLPTKIDPSWSVRDFGPGIDTWRMDNVFINYCESTKRDSDEETGGYGLGCKCGFSYSDTFTVVTITDEFVENQTYITRLKRTYIAYLDETRMGSMSLVSEEDTEEETGTTIIIASKSSDFGKFNQQVIRTTKWWDVKPKIVDRDNFIWPTITKDDKGDGWCIEHKKSNGEVLAIVDGIPYNLNLQAIYPCESVANTKHNAKNVVVEPSGIPEYALSLSKIPLRLFFKTGEIPISATRESIDYQSFVIVILQKRIKKVYNTLIKRLNDDLWDAKNLWDANIIWNLIKHKYEFLKDIASWNGHPLSEKITFKTNRWEDPKTNLYRYDREHDRDENRGWKVKISKQRDRWRTYNSIACIKGHLLVEDDTLHTRPPRSRILTLFDRRSDIDTVYVVKIPDHHLSNLEKKYGWSALGITKLSTVPKTLKKPKIGKPQKAKSWAGDWIPCDIDVRNGNGIYVVQYKGKYYLDNDKKRIIENNADYIKRELDVRITSILARYVPKMGSGWKSLGQTLKEKIDLLEEDPEIKEWGDYKSDYTAQDDSTLLFLITNGVVDLVLDKSSIFHEYFNANNKIMSVQSRVNSICKLKMIMGISNSKHKTISHLHDKFQKTYPLLDILYLNSYRVKCKIVSKHIAKYVNTINLQNHLQEK